MGPAKPDMISRPLASASLPGIIKSGSSRTLREFSSFSKKKITKPHFSIRFSDKCIGKTIRAVPCQLYIRVIVMPAV